MKGLGGMFAFNIFVFVIRVFLTALCFTSTAYGDPVSLTLFFHGISAGLGGTVILTSASSAAFALGTTLVGLAGSLLINTAITAGVSLIVNALRPPAQTPSPSQQMINLRQPVQDMRKGYGLVRSGGTTSFWESVDGKRYVAVLMHAGEISSVESLFLDETEVTLDEFGFVEQAAFIVDGFSKVQAEVFLGGVDQVAPSLLESNFDDWTSAEKYTGLAGVVFAFENVGAEDFSGVYPSGGVPTITALKKLAKVYDPRSGLTVYSDNLALCLADWLVSTDGLNARVDWDDVALEADICDLPILDRNGYAVAKYAFSESYSLAEPRSSVLNKLTTAGDVFVYSDEDGRVGFRVGRWIEPDVTISDEHINSFDFAEGHDGTKIVNAVAVQYTEPAAGYRQHQSAAYFIDDGNPYQEEVSRIYGIPNHNQAVRIAKSLHRGLNAEYTVSMNLNLFGWVLRSKRFFRLELSELQISCAFEIVGWELTDDFMSINITAKSVTKEGFDFDSSTEEPAPNPIGSITVSDIVDDPENVVLTSPDPGQIYISFDSPSRSSLIVRLRYRKVSTSDWFELSVPNGQDYQLVAGLPFGDVYEAQVQFRTAGANASNWIASAPISIEVAATSAPPLPVTGVSVVGNVGNADFNWTGSNSPNYVGSRIYTHTSNDFGASTLSATEYGLPNNADSDNVVLAADTYYGWVVGINSAGDEATEVATGSFVVS